MAKLRGSMLTVLTIIGRPTYKLMGSNLAVLLIREPEIFLVKTKMSRKYWMLLTGWRSRSPARVTGKGGTTVTIHLKSILWLQEKKSK